MSISIWDIFRYIFKWKVLIAVMLVISFLGATFYVNANQTYSSKVVIQYEDKCISDGKTLDGQVFDSNEIKSPKVILNVLQDLGYETKKIESVRENITITPITPKTVENLKEANEKLGEEYQFFPKTFSITFKGNSSFESTRDILASVISNYFNYYSETYLYLATLNEVDYDLNEKGFDYLEQAEQINENLKQTIDSISSYSHDSAGYRSYTTGLTFDDILKEFEQIEEFNMPSIFSKIFEGQVTQNKELLINKYTERLESNERDMDNLDYKATLTADRMDAFVEASKNVENDTAGDNDDDESRSIIREVEYDHENEVDETTTYDTLITSYANDSVAANNKKIDAEYCKKVISNFEEKKDGSKSYSEYEEEVKSSIADVLDRLQTLYQKANLIISDYNRYIPALHIKKLSDVSYYENLSGTVYKLIAVVAVGVLTCICVCAYEIIKKYSIYSEASKAEMTEPDPGENG